MQKEETNQEVQNYLIQCFDLCFSVAVAAAAIRLDTRTPDLEVLFLGRLKWEQPSRAKRQPSSLRFVLKNLSDVFPVIQSS